jgi:hypothetical protein
MFIDPGCNETALRQEGHVYSPVGAMSPPSARRAMFIDASVQ